MFSRYQQAWEYFKKTRRRTNRLWFVAPRDLCAMGFHVYSFVPHYSDPPWARINQACVLLPHAGRPGPHASTSGRMNFAMAATVPDMRMRHVLYTLLVENVSLVL
jgi:hypothetical protein